MSGARPDVRHHEPSDRSTIVTDDAGLSAWKRSWVGEDTRAGAIPLPRVFMPLLADASFLSPFTERMGVPAAASSIEVLMSLAFQICSALKWIGSGEA